MKEEFVTKGIAKKLKEKGFKEGCFGYCLPGGDTLIFNYDQWRGGIYEDCLYSHNSLEENVVGSDLIDVPTVSQALKWLREEKKIYVVVTPYPSMSTKDKVVWCYQIKHNSDGAFMDEIDGLESYMDYRGAAINGIEYVLDNLI